MAKEAKTIDSWKKKRWHPIAAPKLFGERIIGESPALEPGMMIGRTIQANLTNMTGDIKKQYIDVTFEVDRIMGDTAYTFVRSFSINPSAMKRFVRRGKKRVDDSFRCKTSDGKIIMVKPFLVTKSMTTNSITTKLRKTAKDFLVRTISTITYDQLCSDFINYNMQKAMKSILNKIYPLKICEVRALVLAKGSAKPSSETPAAETAPEGVNAEAAPVEAPAEAGSEEKAEELTADVQEEEEKPKKEKESKKKTEDKESKEDTHKKPKKKEE